MIVDTSALVAILSREDAYEPLLDAVISESCLLPAPAYVEFARVATKGGSKAHPAAEALIANLLTATLRIEPFTHDDARAAESANLRYGSGNRSGGLLNLLDLMVYAVARQRGMPILCTGKDYPKTDAMIHPASRDW